MAPAPRLPVHEALRGRCYHEDLSSCRRDRRRIPMPSPASSPSSRASDEQLERRKSEHLDLALEERMQGRSGHFDRVRLRHRAMPEIALDEVSTASEFLGKRIAAPLIIGAMTGGTERAREVNRNLASAAQSLGLPFSLGSQRAALEDPDLARTYKVRDLAPDIPILANLGMVQLNYGYGLDHCRRAVEMVEADALALHLNALQEAIQPEGQADFSDLLRRLEPVVDGLGVPIVVKEIGNGIDRRTARRLRAVGVTIVDAAGSGGTDWARIEASRADDRQLGDVFAGWGTPAPLAIKELAALTGIRVIGSGGVRTGLDGAKALALGASWVAMAQPFLAPALAGADKVTEEVQRWLREFRIAMFCSGAADLEQLGRVEVAVL